MLSVFVCVAVAHGPRGLWACTDARNGRDHIPYFGVTGDRWIQLSDGEPLVTARSLLCTS